MNLFKPFSELSPNVIALVGSFGTCAVKSDSLNTLSKDFEAFIRDIGFRYFAIVDHRKGGNSSYLSLHNYPEIWAEDFDRKGYAAIDPVHKACRKATFAFPWSDLPRFNCISSDQISVIEQGIRAGLGDGYTVPFRFPCMRTASCSFATRPGTRFPDATLLAAQWAASIAIETALRLIGPASDQIPRLTQRQRQCVELMAAGKSDWEIGTIVALSEDTVTKYLNAARARFGVSRRTQLAFAAMFAGEIGPDEIWSWA